MLKESAYASAAPPGKWCRNVVLPYTRVGVVGGIMLGLGRALGETMAVTFVIGNAHQHLGLAVRARQHHLGLDRQRVHRGGRRPATPSSLIALGLVLFFITFVVLAIARYMLLRIAAEERVTVMADTPIATQQPALSPAAAAATPSP